MYMSYCALGSELTIPIITLAIAMFDSACPKIKTNCWLHTGDKPSSLLLGNYLGLQQELCGLQNSLIVAHYYMNSLE